ncbi:hypothetical protein [Homoserinimonas hongtaonis]|uniref:hypothetical protein n=1 Tax=Homoserinimonas hongtaonis TaxID=2079791 RepID=UPI00131F0467|nr:hypothetical protein [Salinibacterium hongtaonis]
MKPRGAKRWTRVFAIVAAALCLSACFPPATPPQGARESLTELENRFRDLPGVSTVEASLGQVDPKDQPRDWLARVLVTAVGTDLELAGALREAAVPGVRGAELTTTLELPAGEGVAATVVDALDAAEVEFADTLRRSPQVAYVSLTPLRRNIDLERQASLSEGIALARPAAGTDRLSVTRADVTISVTDLEPGAALIALFESLSDDPAVSHLYFAAGAPTERASLNVMSDDVGRMAEALARTPDDAADRGQARRVAFTVTSADSEERVSGWLGLPLGSSPPNDEPQRNPEPSSAPNLTAERSGAISFLEETVLAAAGTADVDSREESCADGVGMQIRAFTLLPLSSLSDGLESAFARVTAHWSETGLQPYDRAMGTDIWRVAEPRTDRVHSASIRGSSEGLSLAVTSACAT